MDHMVSVVLRDVGDLSDALEAECWASEVVSTWDRHEAFDGDGMSRLVPAFVRALERKASPKALATLCALGAVGGESDMSRAQAAAGRLVARGLAEPPWYRELGRAEPRAAALLCDEAFDDGVSVFVEFASRTGGLHTLGVYIDHNMGALVKDVFIAGALDELRDEVATHAPPGVGPTIRELDLAEARARIEAALYMLDHTYDPPVDEDVYGLRALIDARLRRLPAGFELSADQGEISAEQRQQLFEDFLSSPDGARWCGDEDAEDVIRVAIDFGADYNHGGPLRWSPVVVEIFMTSWLPRKLVREPGFFELVPQVLPDWVRYAGRARGVPDEPLSEAVGTAQEFREEMLETVNDSSAWGPAKAFALAAQAAGVDLGNPDAMNAFIDRYNEGLAA
jgi:hypothetical protein